MQQCTWFVDMNKSISCLHLGRLGVLCDGLRGLRCTSHLMHGSHLQTFTRRFQADEPTRKPLFKDDHNDIGQKIAKRRANGEKSVG